MYFLGSLCKKPMLQVLMPAVQHDHKAHTVCLSVAADGVPCFLTSYDLFLQFAQQQQQVHSNMPFDEVLVEQISFNAHHGVFQKIPEVYTLQHSSAFKISLAKPAQVGKRLVQTQLPFGLKLPPRVRKPRAQTKSGPAGPAVSRKRAKAPVSSSSPSSSSEPGALVSSSCDSDSGSDSDSDSDPVASHSEGENQLVVPPTQVAQAEKVVLQEVTKEFNESVAKRAELAEQVRSSGLGRSHFVKSVGFEDGGIATSGRSVCYHCNQKINNGLPRFSYFWDTRKPSRWMHASCVVGFVQANPTARQAQAVSAMARIVSQMSGAASSTSSEPVVKRAAEEILSHLS